MSNDLHGGMTAIRCCLGMAPISLLFSASNASELLGQRSNQNKLVERALNSDWNSAHLELEPEAVIGKLKRVRLSKRMSTVMMALFNNT
jgi:hypothetical protein